MEGLGSVVFVATGYRWTAVERSVFSDWLLVDELWNLVIIGLVNGGQAVERSVYSEWLLVDRLGV